MIIGDSWITIMLVQSREVGVMGYLDVLYYLVTWMHGCM